MPKNVGRLEDAADLCTRALTLHRQLGFASQKDATVLRDLGMISHHQGQLDQAATLLAEARVLYQMVGYHTGEAEHSYGSPRSTATVVGRPPTLPTPPWPWPRTR